MPSSSREISAVDLFCGAGGLAFGMQQASVSVVAGFDLDGTCQYAFETNVASPFLERDVRDVTSTQLDMLWASGVTRLLAGCAPCQPFSPYRRGVDTSDEKDWSLLKEFGRLVEDASPELVTMENVPRIGRTPVFNDFVGRLRWLGYHVDWKNCYGPRHGLAQHRRRLVLLASKLGPIEVPRGASEPDTSLTVRSIIGDLPRIPSGGTDPEDRLHTSRELTPINMNRIRASKPGGTWRDWPEKLRAPCHRKASGSTFKNVYARMEWDAPAPTITTLAHNFGTGRFGHPVQDRPISLREAAMLQGFPRDYRFVREKDPVRFNHLGRLIGNAVPPPIGRVVGETLVAHVRAHEQS